MSNSQKQKRSNRVRYSLKKRNKDRLRLSVFKSSKNLYVQVIDDNESKTICSASSLATSKKKNGCNIESAKTLGATIAKLAKENNIPIILDPAPYRDNLDFDYYKMADFITPNEIESEYMTRIKIQNIEDAKKSANLLVAKGIKNCIITLGENGAYFKNENFENHFKPHKIQEVKASVAAGDAFSGILGAALASGEELNKSIDTAIVGSALSVTKYGAQESMPLYDEIINALN